MSTSDFLLQPDGSLFGHRYRPLQRLGGGCFGEVWRAEDTTTGRIVALKLIDPDSTQPEMAWREATHLTSLESPHLVRVHGAAMANDMPFIDMALAEGGSVANAVSPYGTDAATAARWTQQVSRGLQLCHNNGLLHRDVKPENIVLTKVGIALLGDFGVTALMRTDQSAEIHGDPHIIAPESFLSRTCRPVTDVYSLGVSLFYMLTGKYPYVVEDYYSMADFAQAVQGGLPDIRDVAPHVNRTLAKVVRNATAVDPRDRIRTANGLDEALAHVKAPKRSVVRVHPHQIDGRCWKIEAPSRGSQKALHVCANHENQKTEITVVHEHSRTKVRSLCGTVDNRKANVRLRAIFDRYT